ncbi:restriction endonuclease subunit S [Wenyingzhuangia marina]|uniref:Type I restriction enzyme, S subunit n=1 Tax=Wenyingzhuangia marina TaxID=1195760 RepID=A0A1M5S5U2_9FLAO|nr:restriction endonuclease subunit S [Wenyingzhuangia marina]GGF79013.1 type I restriction-modification protein subunit S [Wenyingzhuangia marina]SHH33864.1 type I restriction enzyme, S subunit [Wenyingzhuangia marina]
MKKYKTYKDSGIEWIGEIPEDWESWKISHAFKKIGSGTTPQSGNPLYYENGTINWLNTGDLNDSVLYSCAKKVTPKAIEDNSSLKLFPKGSLVIAMYGATIGKTALLQFETTTNQACCVFNESDIIDIEFLQYWFKGNKEHIINLAIGGGQPNISQDILKGIRLYCPSKEEQTQIANYLNQKTEQLDRLIAKKEQLINLLQEERIAMINQAVTKGLDLNVPMKDSGIEWLGEIPEHWEVGKLKLFTDKITDGSHHSPPTMENGKRYLSVKDIGDNELIFEDCKLISEEEFDILVRNGCQPIKNDILLTKDGTIGRAALVKDDNDFVVLSSLGIIRPNQNYFSPLFLRELLVCSLMVNQMLSLIQGSALTRITISIIKNLYITLPPLKEQIQITNYLNNSVGEINRILLKVNNEINLLKEYKTALISEVVTGKVDVREEVLAQ